MSCKNLTNWDKMCAFQIIAIEKRLHQTEIMAWRKTCESREVFAEMRLVMIMALGGDVCPVNALVRLDSAENRLKAIDSRQCFGRDTNNLLKTMREVFLADSNLNG